MKEIQRCCYFTDDFSHATNVTDMIKIFTDYEYLYFEIDCICEDDEITRRLIERILLMIEKYIEYQDEYSQLLRIEQPIIEEHVILIQTKMPYTLTFEKNYTEDDCEEFEMRKGLKDIMSIYEVLVKMGFPVILKKNDMSIVPQKNFLFPFP